MDAGLRVRVALHTDRLARTFARAGVGLRALSPNGQAAHVANATITFDALEALQVHAQFAAQVTFDDILAVLNGMNDLRKLGFRQIFGAGAGIDFRDRQNIHRVFGADAVNVTERDINALVRRDFYTNDACHKILTLPLLVAFVAANDANHAFAPDDFAVFAKLLY